MTTCSLDEPLCESPMKELFFFEEDSLLFLFSLRLNNPNHAGIFVPNSSHCEDRDITVDEVIIYFKTS